MRELDPETALQEAAAALNSHNLDALWCLCSLLSCEESLPRPASWDPPTLFPVLHHERVRLFCEVVLASKAASYKTALPTARKLIDVFNLCGDMMGDPNLPARLQRAREEGRVDEEILVYFAWIGNVQIRTQDSRHHQRVGQLFAMFKELPRRYPELLPADKRELAVRCTAAVPEALGAELEALWICWLWLLTLCRDRSLGFSEGLQRRLKILSRDRQALESDKDLQIKLFREILGPEVQRLAADRMRIRVDDSRGGGGVVTPDDRKIFLDLMAQPTRELRQLRSTSPEYSIGPVGSRLSVLERYPIVRLDDDHVVVPNLRFYMRNFPDIIHYALLDRLGDGYSQARGVLQELFLRVLVSERLPGIKIIEERPYRRAGGEVRGPDLTLIEGNRLIVLESKARRIQVETRFTMTPEAIGENLEDAIRQILGLGWKIEDLRAGLDVYRDLQHRIDETADSEPVRVAVLGEEFTFMGDVVRHIVAAGQESPLREVPGPFCVMGLGTFERAVELAAQHGISLCEVLQRHWESSSTIDPSIPGADEFPGLPSLTRETFSESFLPELGE